MTFAFKYINPMENVFLVLLPSCKWQVSLSFEKLPNMKIHVTTDWQITLPVCRPFEICANAKKLPDEWKARIHVPFVQCIHKTWKSAIFHFCVLHVPFFRWPLTHIRSVWSRKRWCNVTKLFRLNIARNVCIVLLYTSTSNKNRWLRNQWEKIHLFCSVQWKSNKSHDRLHSAEYSV